MNTDYILRLTTMARKLQEPLQSMAELNVKTLQGLTYIKPDHYTRLNKPEDFLEKQVEIAVSNGHKMLDHMQKTFQIMERFMFSFVEETKIHSRDFMNELKTKAEQTKNETITPKKTQKGGRGRRGSVKTTKGMGTSPSDQ